LFFRKNKYYDWDDLGVDWRSLQGNGLSKRKLRGIAKRTAKFICFVFIQTKTDEVAITNFLEAVQKSSVSDYIFKQWEKLAKSRRTHWAIAEGAKTCLKMSKGLKCQ